MSIGGVIVGLVLIAVVLALVIAPLVGRGSARADDLTERQRERLQVYYERVLRNLRDLDEDHALGKLDDADYAEERAWWAERGVQALKALDRIATLNVAGSPTAEGVVIDASAPDDAAIDHAIDAAIEAAVRRARAASAPERSAAHS